MIGDCSLEDILMILLFGIFTKISMNKIKEDEDEAWWIAVKIIYEVIKIFYYNIILACYWIFKWVNFRIKLSFYQEYKKNVYQ